MVQPRLTEFVQTAATKAPAPGAVGRQRSSKLFLRVTKSNSLSKLVQITNIVLPVDNSVASWAKYNEIAWYFVPSALALSKFVQWFGMMYIERDELSFPFKPKMHMGIKSATFAN